MLEAGTLQEIVNQPETWAAAIRSFDVSAPEVARLFQERSPDEVIFTGCGSSYYLSMTAAVTFQKVAGLRSRAVPASEVLQFPGSVFVPGGHPLLVASSRSGTTTRHCARWSSLASEGSRRLASPAGALAVFFGTRAGARLEADLAADLPRHGATVVGLRDEWRAAEGLDVDVALGAGLDPDRPRHLMSVIRL